MRRTDWFQDLTGFAELDYHSTRGRLEASVGMLRSIVNGREFAIGELTTPSVADLRREAAGDLDALAGAPRISIVVGDVARMHRDPANHGALFQARRSSTCLR